MSAGRVFIDTNILVYAYNEADPLKCSEAVKLLTAHAGRFVLSTQVVQEFYAAGVRKLKLPRTKMKTAVQELLKLPLVTLTGEHILSALEFEETYGVSFWDGLILATAASANAETLYTEDLNDGQRYGKVTARNPFAHASVK
jgi:predicted nucleic acid-binding protein